MKIRYIGNKNNTTRIEKHDDVEVVRPLIFDELPWLKVFFSTRMGGVSENEFASMNLGYNRGDDQKNVDRNFEIITNAMGIENYEMIKSKQTHTDNVCFADDIKGTDYDDVDGLITSTPGEVLVTSFADCPTVVIVDRKKRVVASLHSGWKGTLFDIANVGVNMMKDKYNSDPADMLAFVGPSICKDCYEISADVADKFRDRYGVEESFLIMGPMKDRKYYLDLHEACRQNLLKAGLKPENIAVTDICTACNPDFLYSHRKTHGMRGTMCAFAVLEC